MVEIIKNGTKPYAAEVISAGYLYNVTKLPSLWDLTGFKFLQSNAATRPTGSSVLAHDYNTLTLDININDYNNHAELVLVNN